MGKISFTADLWSDKNLRPYLCMTAHWMGRNKHSGSLDLKCALVAFHNMVGKHDGENIARVVVALLDRAGITIYVSNLIFLMINVILICFWRLATLH